MPRISDKQHLPIAVLQSAHKALPWYKVFFFPRQLDKALKAYNRELPETGRAVYDAFNKTWFFHRWFFSCLNIFYSLDFFCKNGAAPPSQATPWLTDTLAELAAHPYNERWIRFRDNNFFLFNRLGRRSDIELAILFAALPTHATSLDLSGSELYIKTGAELASAFAALPTHITSIELSANSLYAKPGVELASAFAALPSHVTSIDLSINDFHLQTGAQLAIAFTALPTHIISINLSENAFYKKSAAQLAIAFTALPTHIRSVNLSGNKLHTKSPNELAIIFAALGAHVITIDLSHNGLGKKTATELAIAFAPFQDHITSINLAHNKFNRRTRAEVEIIFKALPSQLTSINLSGNSLTGAQFESTMKALPISLISINLSNFNPNDNIRDTEFKPIFEALPPQVASVNLSMNELGRKSGAELAIAFKALPSHVTSLDLSLNQFDELSLMDLQNLENTLPHIRNLCLSSDEITKMSYEKALAFKRIFSNIQHNTEECVKFRHGANRRVVTHTEAYIPIKHLGVVPSLKMISTHAFFTNHVNTAHVNQNLPNAAKEYLNT